MPISYSRVRREELDDNQLRIQRLKEALEIFIKADVGVDEVEYFIYLVEQRGVELHVE